MIKLKPSAIPGNWVTLEPLTEAIKPDLHRVAQDQRVWTYNSLQAYEDRFNRWFDAAIKKQAAGEHQPFAVRHQRDNKIVGSTRFYDISVEHRRLTIGYTWYAPEVWGTYVNPECKFLLMRYAFEVLQANRVEFVTDFRNAHSRAALKKLGAQEEGVLRQHLILEDGFVRDTVVFSVIKTEWPIVKLKLEERLNAFR